MRYFAKISYLGKNYHGWQIQPDAISIQQKIEETLSTLLQQKIEIVGAGRTDAGVHASEMYFHFDTNTLAVDSNTFVYKANAILPDDIVVHSIFKVKDSAHTRFDAISRSYEYRIHLGRNPFSLDTQWQIHHQTLNIDAMNKAAQFLLDYKDFQCFSKSKTDVKTFLCDITKAYWKIEGKELTFYITANRFLRNMVRAIVGTLYQIGLEKIPSENIKEIIESKNRSNAGPSVPAHGLFLTHIDYPESIVNV